MQRRSILAFALGTVLVLAGCGAGFRRMPLRPVVWEDPDQQPFSPRPPERYVSWRFDAVDNLFLRPLADVWTLRASHEAINVNALDEVPDSSWFQNRIGRRAMTPAEVARGACASVELDAPFPWTVVGGKTYGTTPGFTIEDANGTRYLLKTDGRLQPERATAADAIAATLFHAAGFYVPCNRVAFFPRDALRIAPGATAEVLGGAEVPLTDAEIELVLREATRMPDGTYRAALSEMIAGEPLGPWSYAGTRGGDPNDVVPHETRRDLRGLYVLFAWLGHIDARQENSMSAWIGGERGYVRHYLIDFSDCFGVLYENDELSRHFEHEHYLSFTTVIVDYLALGLVDRPWYHAELGPAGRTLGYYDARRFDPDDWAPGYSNIAFEAHTEHDAAWMARIVARFGRSQIEAAVSTGRFSRPIVARTLTHVLIERRRKILERYLTRLSPLSSPRVRGRTLCLHDLAVESGIRAAADRRYEARVASSEPARDAVLPVRAAEGEVCVDVPEGLRYAAIDLVASSGSERTLPARVHVYLDGDRARVVGLERLDREAAR